MQCNLGNNAFSCWKSFLGPFKNVKFVSDGETTTSTSCPLVVCENINFQHPVNKLILSNIRSQHDTYGCSTTTWCAMFTSLGSAFRALSLQEGDDIKVLRAMEDVLTDLVAAIDTKLVLNISLNQQKNKIPHNNVTFGQPKKLSLGNPTRNTENVSALLRKISLSSRHLFRTDEQEDNESSAVSKCDVGQIVVGLCHGQRRVAQVLTDLWYNQASCSTESDHSFKLNRILSLTQTGLPDWKILNGIVLNIQQHFVSSGIKMKETYNALLINGSVTKSYKHLGLDHVLQSSVVLPASLYLHSPDVELVTSVKSILSQLQVKMLLVSGSVDETVVDWCQVSNVLVFDRVHLKHLQALAAATGAQIASYLTDCDQNNVARDIKIEVLGDLKQDKNTNLVLVSTTGDNVQTVVIVAPCTALAELHEHILWHCLHRVRNVSRSKKTLPGGGVTEYWAVDWLHSYQPLSSSAHIARHLLTTSLVEYYTAVRNNVTLGGDDVLPGSSILRDSNQDSCLCEPRQLLESRSGQCYPGECKVCKRTLVLDDYLSKVEAWRSALRLLHLIARTDAVVLTGDTQQLKTARVEDIPTIVGVL